MLCAGLDFHRVTGYHPPRERGSSGLETCSVHLVQGPDALTRARASATLASLHLILETLLRHGIKGVNLSS